ncbi:MAG: nitrilase-related carbon-nitrogen hydrolase [Micrococcales bacterium]
MKLTIAKKLDSLCRVEPSARKPLTVALVQTRWHENADEHEAKLRDGIRIAAEAGAQVVFLPELTLSRYPADQLPNATPNELAEDLESGPTAQFARLAAKDFDVTVHASLYEYQPLADGRSYNCAIMVSPSSEIIARTRKLHIPVTAGYYEDKYFAPGPNENPYPVHETLGAKFGLPTCWDEWFPEVARAYSLAGAEVLAYPTAIGSEPDHPAFDTAPLWKQVIVGNAIANGTFMVVPNRYGFEGALNFYGSSFICDPFGRVLAEASRDQDEVLVAELDLDQRRDWLMLFPFLATRRPDTYDSLTAPIKNPRNDLGLNQQGIPGVAL